MEQKSLSKLFRSKTEEVAHED